MKKQLRIDDIGFQGYLKEFLDKLHNFGITKKYAYYLMCMDVIEKYIGRPLYTQEKDSLIRKVFECEGIQEMVESSFSIASSIKRECQ